MRMIFKWVKMINDNFGIKIWILGSENNFYAKKITGKNLQNFFLFATKWIFYSSKEFQIIINGSF